MTLLYNLEKMNVFMIVNLEKILFQEQGLESLFCKGPDSKCFKV